LASVLGFFIIQKWDGDIRAMAILGADFFHPPVLAQVRQSTPAGYDGQFYIALAADPLLRQSETLKALDTPAYRAQRIFVPLLAWLVSLGNPTMATYSYVILCWMGAFFSVLLLGYWLLEEGHHPSWAILFLGSVGFWATVMRALPDAVALALVLLTLCCWKKEKHGPSIFFSVAASFARETSLLASAAIAFHEARHGHWERAIGVFILPLGLFLAWQATLEQIVSSPTAIVGQQNLGFPFSWVTFKFALLCRSFDLYSLSEWLCLGSLALSFLLCGSILPRLFRRDIMTTSFCAFCGLALLLKFQVMVEIFAYARVLLFLPCAAIPIGLGECRPWRRCSFLAIALLCALAGGSLLVAEMRPFWP
jgi:hypothetical protein